MKRIQLQLGVAVAAVVALGLLGGRTLRAQDPLKIGTVVDRTELSSPKGMDAILVLREVPPGGESGKHTQADTEIVYVLEGSITLEVQGHPPVTLEKGQAFHTSAGQVHNVKNASATAPAKALAFYIAKSGTSMEGLSLPTK